MIKIKCINCNSIELMKNLIIIYKNNKIIKKIYFNGLIKLNLNKGIYKIIIINKINCLITPLIIRKENEEYIFKFFNIKPITIILTDKNYKGLKIERGKLILWQNHIQ